VLASVPGSRVVRYGVTSRGLHAQYFNQRMARSVRGRFSVIP
jgi:hypothetical protein